MNHGPIHLHIDELVLEGFNPADRYQILDMVERELTRLLAGQHFGAAGTIIQIDEINAGSFTVTQPGAVGLGRQIARAVHGSVGSALAPATRPATERMPR